MTHVIAKEFGPGGITVNAVSPGATETETYRRGRAKKFLAALAAMSVSAALELAPVAAFLASDRGHRVNAQNVRVNGGTV